MLPVPRFKRQPVPWQMNADPPPWIWMVPAASGLFRIGGLPPPLVVSSPRPPPLLQGVPGWQVPCDPFLPLLSVPSAPDPVLHQYPLPNGQWVFGVHSPVIGFSPSCVEFVPVFPHNFTSTLPPHLSKCWVEKKKPNCKVYFNNAFVPDSAWSQLDESRIFQGHEKPFFMTNQASMAVSRPTTAPRPLHTLVLTPQPLTGACQSRLKHIGSNQAIALASAMMAIDAEAPQGPSSAGAQPCHILTLSPIRIPILTTPHPGAASRMNSITTPLMPPQLTRLTAVTAPAVTFMAANLVEKTSADKRKEAGRTSCSTALILHADRKNKSAEYTNKDQTIKVGSEEGSRSQDTKPVASTPVPGSSWCIVWTGDDRVFFFNPKMQLSVWEKPMDLKNRGDIIRIIEDPPHKRKLETSATIRNDGTSPEEVNEDHSTKTKRNKTEDLQAKDDEMVELEDKSITTSMNQVVQSLEERMTNFREMLLERGVSAFSTWEKELHKIVFDPRYLLLNSEERKQVFEQFVKTRIKEEYKEKRSKLLLAKEEFKKLLEESKLSSRSTFKEFAEKYGRDQRFRLVQKKKDQERFFNQFIHLLKKRDKENRLKLRKMR
uniref:Transcription elongation regulator 1-like protein n=1 Tax=Geotrypetes seraphini TaxID=260995 RepID=A0A6P8QQC1_GEOSA|nr:transcription elongation regulator 1-like protein isoform X2 [Geotrypetes seraphini]